MEIMLGTKRDRVFLEMAYCIAQLSKDQSTHIGAVIVGPDHEVRSVGYNSFPRGIDDSIASRQERPGKYYFFAHAEANAIFNAARIGIPLKNCRIYTNGTPCDKCAQAIIGAGINEIIIDNDWEEKFMKLGIAEWKESTDASKIMLDEAKVKIWALNSEILRPKALLRGELISY